MTVRIGLPKGSLQQSTLRLFESAGFRFAIGSRSYVPVSDDPELSPLLIRAQEIPPYVQDGVLDCGISGYDWIRETDADVVEMCELVYARQGLGVVKVVCAVPNDSGIQEVAQLSGRRIATEYVGLTTRWLKERGVEDAVVEFSWGATEVKAPDLVDAIVELTETGRSLRAHGLRIIDTVLESTTRFVANRAALEVPDKRRKIENVVMLLEGALRAETLVGLKMNVPKAKLDQVVGLVPALRRPTVSPLADGDWVALETIIEQRLVRDLIPELKRAGAEGLVEYPLNKVIP
jgi:ATP phosphoribosyltransferase